MSYKDIIQCLGRGFRSDKLGDGGKNKDKVLHIHVPIYYENDSNSTYKKYSCKEIKKVLSYLIEDCNVNFEELIMKFNKHFKSNFGSGYDNIGQEDMKKQVIDLLKNKTILLEKAFMRLLKENNITNEIEYNEFAKSDYYNIPDIANIRKTYPQFCFKDIIDNTDYYSTKEEAEEAIEQCKRELIDNIGLKRFKKLDYDEKIKKFNLINNKIPNIDLDLYYN